MSVSTTYRLTDNYDDTIEVEGNQSGNVEITFFDNNGDSRSMVLDAETMGEFAEALMAALLDAATRQAAFQAEYGLDEEDDAA